MVVVPAFQVFQFVIVLELDAANGALEVIEIENVFLFGNEFDEAGMEACLLGSLSTVGVLLDKAVDSRLNCLDLSADCVCMS